MPSFVYNLTHTAPYEVVADEIEIVTHKVPNSVENAEEVDPQYVNGDATKDVGEELDVEETLVVEEKEPQILRTLLTGRPSPTSWIWSAITLTINVVIIMLAWDLVYRAPLFYPSHDLSMARVGYVSDSTAKILVREPDATKYPIFISYRHADSILPTHGRILQQDSSWKSGGSIDWLYDGTDFTGTFELKGLKSDTRYQYVAGNHTGFFTTAPRAGYTTTRLPAAGTFTFLHTSCLKNNLPYNPLAHPLSNKGLKHLTQVLENLKAQFMLFLGDFI